MLRTEKEKAAFLRGFADAEGHVHFIPPSGRIIDLVNTDKEIMDIVYSLMLDLGFKNAKFRHIPLEGKKDQYKIDIYNHDDSILWYSKVGFHLDEKAEELERLVNSYNNDEIERRKKLANSKVAIVRDYQNADISVQEIADKYESSLDTIVRIVRTSGVMSRSEVLAARKDELKNIAQDLYVSHGLSLRKTAEALCVHHLTVRAWLIESGVRMRGKNEKLF